MLAPLELIRTRLKEKLPKGFSYPVGAEMISTALEGIPHFQELSIRFSWKDRFWASKYNASVRAAGKLTMISVNFWREWVISVHAVPSQHRNSAQVQLGTLLPVLANQLRAAPTEATHCRWEASYDLASSTLAIGG